MTSQQWQYLCVRTFVVEGQWYAEMRGFSGGLPVERYLNERGAEGWELVRTLDDDPSQSVPTLVLKRPKA